MARWFRFACLSPKEIDTLGVPVVAGEWKKDELEKRGQQIVGDIVTDYVRISQEVFGGYRKTICFSCGLLTVQTLCAGLARLESTQYN